MPMSISLLPLSFPLTVYFDLLDLKLAKVKVILNRVGCSCFIAITQNVRIICVLSYFSQEDWNAGKA